MFTLEVVGCFICLKPVLFVESWGLLMLPSSGVWGLQHFLCCRQMLLKKARYWKQPEILFTVFSIHLLPLNLPNSVLKAGLGFTGEFSPNHPSVISEHKLSSSILCVPLCQTITIYFHDVVDGCQCSFYPFAIRLHTCFVCNFIMFVLIKFL